MTKTDKIIKTVLEILTLRLKNGTIIY